MTRPKIPEGAIVAQDREDYIEFKLPESKKLNNLIQQNNQQSQKFFEKSMDIKKLEKQAKEYFDEIVQIQEKITDLQKKRTPVGFLQMRNGDYIWKPNMTPNLK